MWWILGPLLGLVLLVATNVGVHSQSMSPWWFARGDVGSIVLNDGIQNVQNVQNVQVDSRGGVVSDLERYSLARAAGFNPLDAVTATAISIAEDGSGDPAARSAVNRDGSFDFCLLQVNSAWFSQVGGMQALADPLTCFKAGFMIYGRQGFCAWSTWEERCGPGHNGSYRAYLNRAHVAALRGN